MIEQLSSCMTLLWIHPQAALDEMFGCNRRKEERRKSVPPKKLKASKEYYMQDRERKEAHRSLRSAAKAAPESKARSFLLPQPTRGALLLCKGIFRP